METRHLRSILILPGNAFIVIPGLILYFTRSLNIGWGLAAPFNLLTILAGLLVIILGLLLMVGSIRQFIRRGEGTLAPWEPTQKLVVEGIYRYVRNPMHSGVFTVLYGEGILLGSLPIIYFATAAFVFHWFYIPFSEERGLENRFGEDYLRYKRNVPRWFPRLTPWQPEQNENA